MRSRARLTAWSWACAYRKYHGNASVPGKLLQGLYVGTLQRQAGDGGVAHHVRRYQTLVHAGAFDAPCESLIQVCGVSCLGAFAWKYPAVLVAGHGALAFKNFGNATREWLIPPSSTLDLDAKATVGRVKVLKSGGDDFGVPKSRGES